MHQIWLEVECSLNSQSGENVGVRHRPHPLHVPQQFGGLAGVPASAGQMVESHQVWRQPGFSHIGQQSLNSVVVIPER